jgi:hypothetical protein
VGNTTAPTPEDVPPPARRGSRPTCAPGKSYPLRERPVVQVISCRVAIDASGGETVECDTGTLVTFDPGERHAAHGLDDET